MISLDQITFVIATFKSEKVIFDCLSELPSVSPKIIVENSNDENFKNKLEKNFSNLDCLLMNRNSGYGTANNFGIKKCTTKYISNL